MLSALLGREFERRGLAIEIESAGLKEKVSSPASDNARATMLEMGIDIDDHMSRHVTEVPNLEEFTHVYCMGADQLEQLVALGIDRAKVKVANQKSEGVPNPWPHGMDVYRKCALVLVEAARDIADEIQFIK
jgi:protein-tyrosine-phosphatase